MTLGLLECDHVGPGFRHIAGDYRDMFAAWLPGADFRFFDVCKGHFPAAPDVCDAWICTGSRFSAYDEEAWILDLKAFIKDIDAAGKKYVGVCFGHQMLGEALGGKVEKAVSGWHVGIHEFEIKKRETWMEPFGPSIRIAMMCQDQVVAMPAGATLLASLPTCPVAMFRVGERMLGVQGHPEFPMAYEQALMESRIERIGTEKVRAGLASLGSPADAGLWAAWVLKFIGD